jgi:hypothetical protein
MATTDTATGRIRCPASDVKRGWLILVQGYGGGDPSWQEVATVETRIFFVNGGELLLWNDDECTTTALHQGRS